MVEINLKFDRHRDSTATETSVKFQSDWKSLNNYLGPSRCNMRYWIDLQISFTGQRQFDHKKIIWYLIYMYRQSSDMRRTLVGNKRVDHSDVVGASPVGTAPTISSFSTQHLTAMDWANTMVRRDEKHLSFGIWCTLRIWRQFVECLSLACNKWLSWCSL